ncbi:hypothetical protein CLPU_20c00130 [Gottschalkia purinilytica]|uniref:TVP38/TMEM64 family membrane protein n=1 Tax=Gottschalkia purinilytica TaxID=1503 RepID=A0A0L0W6Y7_GOTPU|nr:VTT domain-containing protein [Gottschalkia purinilytica]KNF07237.1 hypothetical protein CLPU_20c00130 [Gottschalkia purinilytica]
MNINKKYFIALIIWTILICVFKKYNLIALDTETIKQYLVSNTQYTMIAFIGLWVIRLLFFIPGVILMVLGGICFGSMKGFLLSMLGFILSETLVYLAGRKFSNSQLRNLINSKHPEMVPLIEKYKFKFLALGVLCPVAPTDIICFLSASTRVSYIKYILSIILANTPAMLLYSYMGIGYKDSVYSITLLVISISIITFYSTTIWNSLKDKVGC